MQKFKMILASGSPRRKEILKEAGYNFDVIPSDATEEAKYKRPAYYVQELAAVKVKDVCDRVLSETKLYENGKYRKGEVIILGADTVVCLYDDILGKPKNEKDAFNMIKSLSGKKHCVYTGISLIRAVDGKVVKRRTTYLRTGVNVAELSDDEINEYIKTGECMDKAGAYAIQGKFAKHIERIEGNYHNVVGLPINEVYKLINTIRGV
ncbi:MAG: septum formation protein Maf [Lachnospiraceae bacterium]|jgi:septum formation protein|nr:septum formation protein Maf [Lachnospiraceae bacterium]MBR0434937.1 septum formation protein Maf [Lachnospiraceae bacterium]